MFDGKGTIPIFTDHSTYNRRCIDQNAAFSGFSTKVTLHYITRFKAFKVYSVQTLNLTFLLIESLKNSEICVKMHSKDFCRQPIQCCKKLLEMDTRMVHRRAYQTD